MTAATAAAPTARRYDRRVVAEARALIKAAKGLLGSRPASGDDRAVHAELKTATTAMQTAVAAAALMNGGKLIPPTFLLRSEEQADAIAEQVVSSKTSAEMRYLYRLNAEKGSGKRAEVPGYRVGGKTGTAEKVVNGRYSSDKRFNAFLAAFPMDDPEYVVLTVIDEPKPEKPGMGATAGSNAAPIVANIIRRAASMLGVKPDFGHEEEPLLVSYP